MFSAQDGRPESSQYIADDIEYLKFREDEINEFKSGLSRYIYQLLTDKMSGYVTLKIF